VTVSVMHQILEDFGPSWTILIPTIPQREASFRRLLDVLLPQLAAHPQVRVLAWRNVGDPPLGELRDGLVDSAGTDYVSFIDDDDLVPEFYVAEIVQALAERPDHVGFQLEYTTDQHGHLGREIVEHSLKWRRWSRVDGVLCRDFTHLDPVRTEFAQRGRFAVARPRRAEDRVWVKQVRPYLGSEVYIPKIMYHYLWSQAGSSWERPHELAPATGPLPAVDHPSFSWHRRSV
jgi:hypothetical protein